MKSFFKIISFVFLFLMMLTVDGVTLDTGELINDYNIIRSVGRGRSQPRSIEIIDSAGSVGGRSAPLETIRLISNDDVNYKIVTGDQIEVTFSERGQDNNAVYSVSNEGEILLPLVGLIKIAGLTKADATRKLDRALGKFIRHPNVRVAINNSGTYMIDGAIGRPGVYPMSPRLTIMEAVMLAGYNKNTAKLNSIVVMRGPIESPMIKQIDLKKFFKNGDRTDNIYLKPGDFVFVPKTFLASADEFIDKAYDKLLIWYGLGGQNIIRQGEPYLGPFEN